MRSLLLFVLLILFSFFAKGSTFEVTSNADSGPNTLRSALIFAATSPDATFITFKLPGVTLADRTIILLSSLPEITKSVNIDGTTQLGTSLGLSGAKVILNANSSTFPFFVVSGIDITVEIYGLKLYKNLPLNTNFANRGIYVKSRCKLTVGAVNKGNIFGGFATAIDGDIVKAIIQSNFFGLAEDGVSSIPNGSGFVTNPTLPTVEITIGGTQRSEGNLFFSNSMGLAFNGNYTTTTSIINVTNNSFGTDITETQMIAAPIGGTHIYVTRSLGATIRSNVFTPNADAISGFDGAKMIIMGNFIGTNRTQTANFPRGTYKGVFSNSHTTTTIGSEASEDQNVIANFDYALISSNFSSVLVTKNNFFCNRIIRLDGPFTTDMKILNLQSSKASGTAIPGALIQLYKAEVTCGYCNPKERFASVIANTNGDWEYNGTISGPIMATQTVGSTTSGFEPISLQDYELVLTHFDCNHNGGIEVIKKRLGAFKYEIKDKDGVVVSTDQNEKNLIPGRYFVELSQIGGCVDQRVIDINDYTPISHPSTFTLPCNTSTFSVIGNVYVPRGVIKKYFWEDKNGVVFANTQRADLGVGTYYYYVEDGEGCISNKGEIIVRNAPNLPIIDESELVTNDADCATSNGSIKKIKVSNTVGNETYGWQNEVGQFVSTGNLDLIDKPTGKYRFAVVTATTCGTIYSTYYTLKEKNDINIDESLASTGNAKCNLDNGSITGLKIIGTNLSYTWKNETDKDVGTADELKNVPAGKYYLLVKANNCFKKSSVFTIKKDQPQQFPAYQIVKIDASCSQDNGSIELIYGNLTQPKSLRWVNSQGININTTQKLSNLPGGKYDLYLSDQTDCENFYQSFTISTVNPLIVDVSSITKSADQCGQGTGSIQGITATADHTITYVWKNEANATVGNDKELENAKSGNYILTVNDGLNTPCSVQTFPFTIESETVTLTSPTTNNTTICAAGKANLSVVNPTVGLYKLYDNVNDRSPQQSNTTGAFIVDVTQSKSFYISYAIGECESDKTEAKVSIADVDLKIPSSFTPNGDGINDFWAIKGLVDYPKSSIKIFNRAGNLIYQKTGADKPFDGTWNNKTLPVGVYYYFIELRKGCDPLNGTLTLIR